MIPTLTPHPNPSARARLHAQWVRQVFCRERGRGDGYGDDICLEQHAVGPPGARREPNLLPGALPPASDAAARRAHAKGKHTAATNDANGANVQRREQGKSIHVPVPAKPLLLSLLLS